MLKRPMEESIESGDPPTPTTRKKAKSTGSPSQVTPRTKRIRGAGKVRGEPLEKKTITEHGELKYPSFYPKKDELGKAWCQGCHGPPARPVNGYRCCAARECKDYLSQLPPAPKDSAYFRKKFRLQAEAAAAAGVESSADASRDDGSAQASSPADVTDHLPSNAAKLADDGPADVAGHPSSEVAKPAQGAPSNVAGPLPSDVAKLAESPPLDVRDLPLADSIKPVADSVPAQALRAPTAISGIADSVEQVEGSPVDAAHPQPSDAAKPAQTEAGSTATPKKAAPRPSRSRRAKTEGAAEGKTKKLFGYREEEVKDARPACGFFPHTENPKTCQSCRTMGRYIENGYRSCNKAWCRDHLKSLPPNVDEHGVVYGEKNADGAPRKKSKNTAKREKVITKKEPGGKTEQHEREHSDDESNSSASDSSSEEESSEEDNAAPPTDKPPVDTPSTASAADVRPSGDKPVVNGTAPPTLADTTKAQNITPPDPSRSPPPSPSPIGSSTSEGVPALSAEARHAKLEELRNLFRSMPQKANFAQPDLDKRIRYLQEKTKKNEPPFPQKQFKDIVVTAKECEELCTVMRASFGVEEEKRRVAAKEQREKEERIAAEAAKLEESRKAADEQRKAAIQARLDEQQREEVERKAKKERLPSAIAKRLRVVLRKGFYPVNGNNYEMTGYFHPKAELDREFIDQHDFRLVHRMIYGKERWALKFEDKDVENTPEHRNDETAFFLSRVSPVNYAKSGACSRDIDAEQLSIDQVVAILAAASNDWKDDCMLVFREFPKPPQQHNSRIAFLIKDVISQTHAEFAVLSEAEKKSEENQVLTTRHEVESLKCFSVLWNQAIVMTCDRCNQTVPMNSGQLQPSDREQWLRKGSRYALDTFVCQSCLNIELDAQTGVDQVASSSAYQASYQANLAYEAKPAYSSYGNSNSWSSDSRDYYHKNSKSNYDSAKCQYCHKELNNWDYNLGYEHNEDYICHDEACLVKHTWTGRIKPKTKSMGSSAGFIDGAHLKKLASYHIDEKKDVFLSPEEWRKCDRSVDYETDVTYNIRFAKDSKNVPCLKAVDVKPAWWNNKS